MKKLVIFDFDGTLVDSVGGLAAAVNYALTELGYQTHSTEAIRGFVGNGILTLLQRALPREDRQPEVLGKIRDIFLEYYDAHNTDFSGAYNGVHEMLCELISRGIKVAIASNKYHAATVSMAKHFFADIEFSAVLGQREGIAIKPDATIVFDAMKLSGIEDASDVLYVGDSGVDMLTAKNAGVDACGVTWGFRSREELESYSPYTIIDSVEQILEKV